MMTQPGETGPIHLVVDLNRCQAYAQCCFLAPDVFKLHGEEALWYDPAPDAAQRERVLRAAAACPVQAIQVEVSEPARPRRRTHTEYREQREREVPQSHIPRDVPSDGHNGHNGHMIRTFGVDRARSAFRERGHIVIVGASLAGLSAAETLRDEGFAGHVTIIGDEPYLPYDRPPLSKEVLAGRFPAEHTQLPRRAMLAGVQWRLGVAATGLDLAAKEVRLADGQVVPYDRLLIATGTRARPWFNSDEATLDGVFTLRGRDDANRLRQRLADQPRRVLVIGGGFTGSEIASVCRELDLPVTVIERGTAPLVGALGGVIAERMAQLQCKHGVDLRCQTTVTALEGDGRGRLRRAKLSDGSTVDADVVVVALGAIRNTEWLRGSGLAVGSFGVGCDAGCRAFDINAIVDDDVFVAGDIARFPHPLFYYQFLALEHWGNAVEQARVAAHNMICAPPDRRPHVAVPVFWSSQFGVNIKSVGVPSAGDQVMITQGSLDADEPRFVAAYGSTDGQIVAALAFDQGKWLEYYRRLIEQAAPFPPTIAFAEQPTPGSALRAPVPADFPDPHKPSFDATVVLTGYDPNEQRVEWVPRSRERASAPSRVPRFT